MIKLINLSFSYRKPIFNNLNIRFDFDKITVLTGENGSGKTTLFRLLSGLNKNYSGEIILKDKNLKSIRFLEIARFILYHKQEADQNIIGITPMEDLKLSKEVLLGEISEDILVEKLKEFGIIHLADKPVWELSIGEKRKTALAGASVFAKKYWLLDEPEGGLEEKSLQKFKNILKTRRQKGYGALIATHRQKLYENIADTILKIENGKICKV